MGPGAARNWGPILPKSTVHHPHSKHTHHTNGAQMWAAAILKFKVPSIDIVSRPRSSAEKSSRAAGRPRARPLSRQNKHFFSKSGAGFSGQKNILRPIFCLCTTIMITNHWAREGVRGLQNSAGRGCMVRGKHANLGNRGTEGIQMARTKNILRPVFCPCIVIGK